MNSLMRFSPTTDMRQLQREIDSVFNDFFTPTRRDQDTNWTPRVDVRETENEYTIHMDLPGMKKDDLNIDFHEGTLTVSGERRAEDKQENESFVRVERSYGSFYRAFSLPKAINLDGIEANYQDGVLTLRVPKAEESKPRRIAVS